MQAPVQCLLSRPLASTLRSARAGRSTQLTAHLRGEGLLLPPASQRNMLYGSTDTRPPAARRWICATTTPTTARYLLGPEALCTDGRHTSHCGAMCHTLHIPASLKQLACHGVTSCDTWLLVQHCRDAHTHTDARSPPSGACTRNGLHWGDQDTSLRIANS